MKATIVYLLAALGLVFAGPGTIMNFTMINNGNDFIELGWNLVGGDVPIDKYTLKYDSFSTDIRCPLEYCTQRENFLDPCTDYNFYLYPFFEGGVMGENATTSGSTLDQIPGAPINPNASANANNIDVSWEPPVENSGCVFEYEVCSRIIGDLTETCLKTNDLTISLKNVEKCSDYIITISAVTPLDNNGPEVSTTVTTTIDVPGIPQNVEVILATETSIEVTFDDPLVNPNCVDEYGVTYGIVDSVLARILPVVKGDHVLTLSPLDPCTNYSIEVFGINAADEAGDASLNYAATADEEPMPPPSVIVTPGGTDSIDVSWPPMPNNKCGSSITICWTDGISPEEYCKNITDVGVIEGGGGYTINGLLPCTYYEIDIVINSPSGLPSLPVGNFTYTNDVKPDPVENLAISSVSAHEFTVSYDPPSNMPQCIREYDTNVINLDQSYQNFRDIFSPEQTIPRIDETHNQLEACSNYRVEVRTVSRQGLESDWASEQTATDGDIPDVVRNLQVQSATESSVTLLWFQPESNPRCVTSYLVEWDVGTDTISATTFAIEYTVSGLGSCMSYNFSVTAQASLGNSSPVSLEGLTLCP
ncbi:hypothetical protein SK128_007754 [Halocaridina rubra]|uniref:Fibronectin type-III domain-containing protein n=1 Tax=Halocaridina rubra TaxID=373956 RepID=A0AAN8WDC8_HALRR